MMRNQPRPARSSSSALNPGDSSVTASGSSPASTVTAQHAHTRIPGSRSIRWWESASAGPNGWSALAGFISLIGRSIVRMRGILLGVSCLVASFQVGLVLQAASYEQAQAFDTLGRLMPAFMQRWMGDSMVALASFRGVVAFGYFHPMIVLVHSMVAAFIASELAADVEAGHVDLLLARPVPRRWLVTRSALLVSVTPAALATLMMAATVSAIALFAPTGAARPSIATILALAVHVAAVATCFGALSLALASFVSRRSAAFGPAAMVAVGLYFTNVLAASWRPAQWVDILSPLHYFQGARIAAGVVHPTDGLVVLVSMAATLISLAYWRFSVRDL
jgi:ABC-2 type transport system permease protein